MKKVIIIIVGVILILGISGILWYNTELKSVSKDSEQVSFIIETGTSSKKIIENLHEANLIRSKTAAMIYVKLNKDISFKAGTYTLDRNMNVKSLFSALNSGGKSGNTFRMTFKEGITLKKYLEQIAEETDLDLDEMLATINDKEFLKPLIDKYWFLTNDILDDDLYYALEGYLFPNTYEFYQNTSFDKIITKMLNETDIQLSKYKTDIENSEYSVHDILTMASIIENEAAKDTDRLKVSQVIRKRLDINMSLGMDATSYYGAKLDMKEPITIKELNDSNPYNTRRTDFLGLPVGPICNSSLSSIDAALHPAKTDYVYFVADVVTRDVYFAKTESEFNALVAKYLR